MGKEGKNGPFIPLFDPPAPATRLPRGAPVLGPRPARALRGEASRTSTKRPALWSSRAAAEAQMSFQWIASDVQTPIVELRRYRLRPGRFDDFVDLFETRFIEQQEAVGARVL